MTKKEHRKKLFFYNKCESTFICEILAFFKNAERSYYTSKAVKWQSLSEQPAESHLVPFLTAINHLILEYFIEQDQFIYIYICVCVCVCM